MIDDVSKATLVGRLNYGVINTPTGQKVRLGDVAEDQEVQNPTDIQRTNASRYVDISGNVTGDRQAVENQVNAQLACLGFSA